MIELKYDEFCRVTPILQGIKHSIPIVFSLIEGNSSGKVLVDHREHPTSALIYPDGGFIYLIADDKNNAFIISASDYVFNKMLEKEIIIFAFEDTIRNKLDQLLKSKGTIRIERKIFNFNLEKFKSIISTMHSLPEEFEIKSMSEEEIKEYNNKNKLNDLAEKKFGYRVMKGDQIVSQCISIFIGGGEAEIDINTNENFRRKGFGKACAVAFIKECLKKDLVPNWSCWPFRKESIALANKLGFEERQDISVHFWAENM